MNNEAQLAQELKHLIVDALMLEEITPAEIEDDTPLFGDEGIGLDSIDALELGMAISKKYKVKLSQDSEETKNHFENVRKLSAFISQKLQEVHT